MKTLFLIGGPMGVGKTSVCRCLQKKLNNSVFLDGDWCWDSNPFLVTEETKEMVMDNIGYLLNSFLRCTAYHYVIFCWVMHEQTIIDSILERLDLSGCEVKSFSLLAAPDVLKERLTGDIKDGKREETVMQRSLERLAAYRALDTVKIDTSEKTAEEVAEEIAGELREFAG